MSDSSSSTSNTGLKYITNRVFEILKEKGPITYTEIQSQLHTKTAETKTRRIYDVLNVLRAVNIIGKRGKEYYVLDSKDDIIKKIEERDKLRKMIDSFDFLTSKNKTSLPSPEQEKLYLPFMVISVDSDSKVHCDTNEENDFYTFQSEKPLTIIEDLEVLTYLQESENEKKIRKMEFLNNFIL
ncbi:Dp [Ecytonucleospora hepatopenaei]|uniref:Dp n=1 Tax=Ecytonucleospora hepatopenaei TaxID=646526 RepID=A0A1W0E748_9MICR|nr:Dp [Ecytonucleospora hepatopenaei]